MNNKITIIDEAHHVCSGVLNGSNDYIELCNALRTEPDIKIS